MERLHNKRFDSNLTLLFCSSTGFCYKSCAKINARCECLEHFRGLSGETMKKKTTWQRVELKVFVNEELGEKRTCFYCW